MKSVVYSTFRFEINHDQPFENDAELLEWMAVNASYKTFIGNHDFIGKAKITDVEVTDDDIWFINSKETNDE